MAESPTEAYCAWFDRLPPEVGRELAAALMQAFPGELLTPSLVTPDPTDGLMARIRRLASTPHRDVGLAATLAALTDLAFSQRGTAEASEETDTLLEVLDQAQESLANADDGLGEAAETWIQEQKLRQPLRARQWAREADGWARLRSGPLSTDELRTYLRNALLGLG